MKHFSWNWPFCQDATIDVTSNNRNYWSRSIIIHDLNMRPFFVSFYLISCWFDSFVALGCKHVLVHLHSCKRIYILLSTWRVTLHLVQLSLFVTSCTFYRSLITVIFTHLALVDKFSINLSRCRLISNHIYDSYDCHFHPIIYWPIIEWMHPNAVSRFSL